MPKLEIIKKHVFKKNSFKIFIDYSIKTIEKIKALNESHETIQLFSIEAIKSLLQTNFRFGCMDAYEYS